jgi:hypothetical protein
MKIATAADLHIGVPNTSSQEICSCLEEMITSSDKVVLAGDTLNSKNQTTSDNVTILLDIFDYITPMIASANKSIDIIYGTNSHDSYPQLQILNPYTKRMKLRIISKVTEMRCGNTSILYIPEEIIQDKFEYYKDTLYSGKKYDYIFGHGVILEGMTMVKENSTTKMRTTPKFRVQELKDAVKYYALFGHYHEQWFDGNVGYCGSLSRFHHGEPKPKGWWLLDGNKIEFHENQWCPSFTEKTIVCSEYTVEDLHTLISNTIRIWTEKKKDRDKIKFTCFLNKAAPESSSQSEIIKSLCRGEGISYTIKDTTLKVVDTNDEVMEKYYFIFDRSIPMLDTINKFNDMKFDSPLDQDLLKHYLSRLKIQEV